jgi:hypothetical protein
MTIQVENGQEIIDILFDGFVTCLKIRKPIALDWYDQGGTVARFYSFAQDFEPIAINFNQVLVDGDDHQVLSAIQDFLQLFRSGQYTVYIDRDKRVKYPFELHTGYYESAQGQDPIYNYYNHDSPNLMFTQPVERINQERVREYEQMILAGGRPKAVLFKADFNDEGTYEDGSKWVRSYDSPLFILDGHHKMLAYKNLQIEAEYVLIFRETVGQEEIANRGHRLYFDYEYFLNNAARQHIISHAPLLCVDNSEAALQYNIELDNYLRTARYIETETLNLFRKSWLSKDSEHLAWLQDRLSILKLRVGDNQSFQAAYHGIHPQYAVPSWFYMKIETMQDYQLWLEKLLESSFDEVNNTIRQ